MTKQEMIDLINKFPDDDDFTYPIFWVRSEVDCLDDEPMTDTQWERFRDWFWDYDDSQLWEWAMNYALERDN